jgi:sigma-B regulation protein RsbU (phosphoserine phosphatase)
MIFDSPPIKKKTLAVKMAGAVLLSTGLIFLTAFGYNYYYSRKIVQQLAKDNVRHVTEAARNRIETIVQGVEKLPQTLASQIQNHTYSQRHLHSLMREMVRNNPEVYGLCVAFEPYARDKKSRYVAPYFYRHKGNITFTSIGSKDYNYCRWDWYLLPRELARPVWCDPYYGKGGKAVMISYSVPFYHQQNGQRQLQGVVVVDIALDWLRKLISDISVYDDGYAFLISKNGKFVSYPKQSYIMRKSIFSLAEAQKRPKLRHIGQQMIHGQEGFCEILNLHNEQECLLFYTPLKTMGWSLGVMVPKQEVFAEVQALNRDIVSIAASGFILMFLVIIFISKGITRPIRNLSNSAQEISQGNLDAQLPAMKSNDEVGQLTSSFDQMRKALKEYIADLTKATQAKERIESELHIAHTIQMSFLPKSFPPFPDRKEFALYATLVPAREVGGDLYDYFFLDEKHLFISIGDVSDKGVPAALFMAVTRTLVKGIAESMNDLSKIMEKVNFELCQDNESNMFVTYFSGILNIENGLFRYSNAGHNPPIILPQDSSPKWLDLPPGLVLGGLEESKYQTLETKLNPGDILVLYTDGVTESINEQQELFSSQGLLDKTGDLPTDEPREIVNAIMRSVREFSQAGVQVDDITLLVLTYKGPQGKSSEAP